MTIYICRGPYIAVTKPFGHPFQVIALGDQQARSRMPKLVEAENEAILVEVENGT